MLLVLSILLAGLRVAGVTHPAFQAVAHLYVGGLIVAGWRGWNRNTLHQPPTIHAIVLSIIETATAIIMRL